MNWTNEGAIGAANGGTAALSGSWHNGGTISTSANGTVNLGGDFATADLGTFDHTGGTVNLTGTLTNTAATLLLDNSKGSWTLAGGTILGGTVAATGTNALVVSSGTVNGVTFDGTGGNNVSPLDMQTDSATLTILGGLSLNGVTVHMGKPNGNTFGRFSFSGASPQTLDGTAANPATLVFGSTGNNSISSGAAYTLGSHLTITGAIATISSAVAFDNQATIVADPTAQGLGQTSGTITLSGVNWTNEGTIGAANGGTAALSGSWHNGGTISTSANGTVNLGGAFRHGGFGYVQPYRWNGEPDGDADQHRCNLTPRQ